MLCSLDPCHPAAAPGRGSQRLCSSNIACSVWGLSSAPTRLVVLSADWVGETRAGRPLEASLSPVQWPGDWGWGRAQGSRDLCGFTAQCWVHAAELRLMGGWCSVLTKQRPV